MSARLKLPTSTGSAMPRVPVRLNSSRSCICMRQTTRAHPASRGRNRHQPPPPFPEATRTGGGPCWWCSTKKPFSSRGEGGGARLFNSTFVRPPCAVPIIPLQGDLYKRVFSLLGQILHFWVGQYGMGQHKRTRALSLAEHSYEMLTRVSREVT